MNAALNHPAAMAANPGETVLSAQGLEMRFGGIVATNCVNLDLKKVQIGTTVYVGGADAGKFKVDPVLFGLGVGKRF